MIATAYTRLPEPFESHDDVPEPKSDHTRVILVNSQGAHLADELPEGNVTLYDIISYEDRVRGENILTGWEVLPLEEGSEEVQQIPIYEYREVVDKVAVLDTFAVSVPVEGA